MANMVITRYNPNRQLAAMREVMDRMLDDPFFQPFRSIQGMGSDFGSGFFMDIYEEGEGYVLEAALPGVRPEDVDISLQGNTLSIKGKTEESQADEGRNYLLKELRGGEFVRTVTLPVEIDSEKVEATFQNGILKLVLPKAPAYQPRRIQVNRK